MQLMTRGDSACGGGDYFSQNEALDSGTVAKTVNTTGQKGHVQLIYPEMTSVMRVSANKMIEVVQ